MDRLIRVAAALAVATVAGIAAVISYSHAYQLVTSYGESGATARALPITIDGEIATCSLVLLDAARRRQPAPVLAWWMLAAGILATLGANVAHGLAHGAVGAVIAGWPAVIAVGSFELLARLIRSGRRAETAPAAPVHVERVDVEQEETPETPALVAPAADDPAVATAREAFAETLAAGSVPSIRSIRRTMHVGHPKAKGIREALLAESA